MTTFVCVWADNACHGVMQAEEHAVNVARCEKIVSMSSRVREERGPTCDAGLCTSGLRQRGGGDKLNNKACPVFRDDRR